MKLSYKTHCRLLITIILASILIVPSIAAINEDTPLSIQKQEKLKDIIQTRDLGEPGALWDYWAKSYVLPNQDLIAKAVIENHNDYPINGLGSNVFVPSYSIGDIKKKDRCEVFKNSPSINMKCDELFPDDISYMILPITESNVEWNSDELENDFSDRPCKTRAWYNKNPLIVREARLTKNDPGTSPSTELEWDTALVRKTV